MDIHVGKSILTEGLLKYKSNSTRILSTHALHFLKYMDYIYILEDGRIVNEGKYEKIAESKKFKRIYKKFI